MCECFPQRNAEGACLYRFFAFLVNFPLCQLIHIPLKNTGKKQGKCEQMTESSEYDTIPRDLFPAENQEQDYQQPGKKGVNPY